MKPIFVSAASREVGCSVLTLINYELKNIVTPKRDSNNRRVYSVTDLKSARTYFTGTSEQKTAIRKRRMKK